MWLECKGSVIPGKDGHGVFAGIMTRLDNQNKYDPLTHLLTGYEMQKYDFSTGRGAILLLGINAFRKINNTSGFLYGNKVLVALAECLQRFMDKNDRVYRLQGDEFIVLSPNGSKGKLCEFFKSVNDYCTNIRGLKSFSVSAGLVSYPEDGTDFNTLMSNMEHSLEYAKEQKQEWIAEFSEKISQRHYRASLLHEALTKSIYNNFEGFELYFQPILDARTRKIVECESLLRWKTPEIPDATPYEFIKLLEDSGK